MKSMSIFWIGQAVSWLAGKHCQTFVLSTSPRRPVLSLCNENMTEPWQNGARQHYIIPWFKDQSGSDGSLTALSHLVFALAQIVQAMGLRWVILTSCLGGRLSFCRL